MKTRPVIKLIPTGFDKILEWIAAALLFIMWILVIYVLLTLSGNIPAHYNFSGEPDAYGKKSTLLVLPVLGTIIYIAVTQLNRYPHWFNYITEITDNNALQQYRIATRMLRVIKIFVLLIFILIILLTYLTATGITHGMGKWFLPVCIGLMILPVIISVKAALKVKA